MDNKTNRISTKIKKLKGSIKLPKSFHYKTELQKAIIKKYNDRLEKYDDNL